MIRNPVRVALSAAIAAALLGSSCPSFAQSDPKAAETKPAEVKPDAKPGTPEFVKVVKGDLALEVRAEAPFQPIDPFEVKTDFKAYTGPLTISTIVEQGTLVRKDQSLITFDRTFIDWAVLGATNELAAAKAAQTKAEIDARLAEESDKLTLRQTEDALKNVEAGKKWFEEVDGPQMLLMADLNVKQAQNSVDDQTDELDQLKKMYAGEELTTATADIVVRRAIRSLEQAKVVLKIQQERSDKTKTFDYPVQRQRVLDIVVQAKSSLEALKATQAQTAVARAAGLQNARTLVEQAEKKLADIKSDSAQFQIKSPGDGVVAYGAMVDGVLTGGDPKAYQVGDKLAAGSVIMRVYQPGKLRLSINLPESQAFWVEKGDKARITPASLPQTSYTAETSSVELQTRAQGMGFVTTIDLENVDARLIPGMKATVVIDAGKVKDALLLPLSSVVGGKVKVKQASDKIVEKAVKVGKTDGKMVQILSGLSEGDEVVK
ncbi:efflux RND transporter periplasmic adaptor subunit [Humisphaera borealis]|uniref:Efflux RND transporter periplasmic adaptor subunit n=1 Tax=Humisphaera borealis TaxID=2807512 RepID=A0A7M2WW58_9BACT|nr:efflux RND transporter periplasmic adaptor subunit [Humisphaera borealis]QOV89725.1 efflux RND transporter periplasmic adaptor subunit [Humisphaera borealis]